MNRIFYGILYSISLLPLGVLYLFADLIFFLTYYVAGYRKKVVRSNLRNAFPEKSEKEIRKISKKFYRNLADYMMETLKCFSISQEELDRRHTYSNLEVFDEFKEEGRDVMMMAGHIFNWEWFLGTVKHLPTEKTTALYHRIYNSFWDEKVNAMRARFGTVAVDKNQAVRYMLNQPNNGETTYLFIADQSPKKHHIHYDVKFLNQDTPVFSAFDKLAEKLNMGVVFCRTEKIKRGHYHTTFEKISPKGEKFESMEVVDQFFEKLERTIREQPDNWLWSHKRWKHKKGIDF